MSQEKLIELKEKYFNYKHDLMRMRDETKDYYFRKSLVGSIRVCDMVLDDLTEMLNNGT